MELKEIYNKTYDLLEHHIQLNKEAMCSLQALGFNGFKKLHKCIAEHLFCDELKLISALYKVGKEKMNIKPKMGMYLEYSPLTLKEHLIKWSVEIENAIEELGQLNKEHFSQVGYSNKILEDLICDLLHYHNKIQCWYQRGENSDWLAHDLFVIDNDIHEYLHSEKKEKHYD